MNQNTPIFRSLDMIEERLLEKLTVGMLADGIHFSKYHYQRMFRTAVGDSVMGYVTRRRLSLAAAELAENTNSVLEIALKYGYDSHEGFTRSFKAYTGMTPVEYRKYHFSTFFPEWRREPNTMMSTKATEKLTIRDEIIRELNSLIVEAGETAAYTRKHREDIPGTEMYAPFWEFAAQKAEKLAGQTTAALSRVTSQHLDEISSRFLIIKALEDAAYEANITAFQTGLTIARALPEHQEAFHPLCCRYQNLADHARIKSEKLVGFLQELSALIFQDMRQTGRQKLLSCTTAGKAAAQMLSDPSLPYSYIAEELLEIADTLSDTSSKDATLDLLENALFRLETIAFAADVDGWRDPGSRSLFEGIAVFREQLEEAADFFRDLPEDVPQDSGKSANAASPGEISVCQKESDIPARPLQKLYSDLAAQESILLFYLKGEIQKLGGAHLSEERKAALDAVCGEFRKAISLAQHKTDSKSKSTDLKALLQEACNTLFQEADRLGAYGGAVRYIAKAAESPLKYLADL